LQGLIIDGLSAIGPESLTPDGRRALADALRDLLNRHRAHSGANWALTEAELAPLERLLAGFSPTDPIAKNLWLFGHMPEIPDSRDASFPERFERTRCLRREALKEVFGSLGLSGALSVMEQAVRPSDVGLALADLRLPADAEMVFLRLGLTREQTKEKTPAQLEAAWQYIAETYSRDGMEWVKYLAADRHLSSNPRNLANLALGLPATSVVWDVLRSWGKEPEALFWERAGVTVLQDEARDAERAVRCLLSAGRPYRALQVACLAEFDPAKQGTAAPRILSPELLRTILRELTVRMPSDEWYPPDANSVPYYVEKLFLLLDASKAEPDQVIPLEFALLPLLENSERGPKRLREAVLVEPGVFVGLLELAYRGEHDEPREATPREQAGARLAGQLLRSLTEVPGLVEQEHAEKPLNRRFDGDIAFSVGVVDAERLVAWVEGSRELAAACDRLGICDSHIGQLLAHSPADRDGVWPCKAVGELVEHLKNSAIESGIRIGVYNKRGVYFRGHGGDQERAIAERLAGLADLTRAKWPRTSALLRVLAEQFRRDARREDEEGLLSEFL